MKSIVNFGAGVNSTAMIIEMLKRGIRPDFVIFADTGSEMPETYRHIEDMKKWFADNGLNFISVSSKHKPIYDYYFKKKMTPSRQFRDCTEKFKKRPIIAFLKKFKAEGVIQYIGIGYDEPYRIKPSSMKWSEYRYPLWDWKITREKCIEIIKEEGIKVPEKSGCFMCPFQSRDSWKRLWKAHGDLFTKSKEMEENGSRYPQITLTFQYNLKQYETAFREQRTIMEFTKSDVCDGWCMT